MFWACLLSLRRHTQNSNLHGKRGFLWVQYFLLLSCKNWTLRGGVPPCLMQLQQSQNSVQSSQLYQIKSLSPTSFKPAWYHLRCAGFRLQWLGFKSLLSQVGGRWLKPCVIMTIYHMSHCENERALLHACFPKLHRRNRVFKNAHPEEFCTALTFPAKLIFPAIWEISCSIEKWHLNLLLFLTPQHSARFTKVIIIRPLLQRSQ